MKRACITIQGIVQGVGFRPFVHRLAKACELNGSIRNTSRGVFLQVEGEESKILRFSVKLRSEAPPAAMIQEIKLQWEETLAGYSGFQIIASEEPSAMHTFISPDLAICPDCLRELKDPSDRRYRYPFINCTNCGPRFTIIRDVPYDRPLTSMAPFSMCPECAEEYHSIENRRYHAQPDCCPACGPQLTLLDAQGKPIEGDAIGLAKQMLRAGKILAVKGLGGFHLACACDAKTVQELRRRKQRDEKPFAVMCRDEASIAQICRMNAEEQRILNSPAHPIVLLEKKNRAQLRHLSDNNQLGVMLPYTPLHHLLFDDELPMLVMTSANLSDTPIVYKNSEALEKLRGIADAFLLHDREILTRCDDSLTSVLEGEEYPIRRSRGYVPYPLFVPGSRDAILACGAEQKAGFCLSKEGAVFPGQHIGDLKNYETYEAYAAQISHFEKLFGIQPNALACDLHPDYLSTAYAQERSEEQNLPLVRVQHHHAHMASCMAENGLTGEVIGLVWDGTGYGTDGTIWGSECLTGGYSSFQRCASILPIPLPGGDRAAKEIYRTAFSLLQLSGCDTSMIPAAEQLQLMLQENLNCPVSSGMGRLFDGICAILGIRTQASYEGQGAVLLEAAAAENETDAWPVTFTQEGELSRFDWRDMVRRIVEEQQAGIPTETLAARFLNTLVELAVQMCLLARTQTGLERVVLSGGSFQNRYLMQRIPEKLREHGFTVYRHHSTAPNDQGVALGQLMVASHQLLQQEE
ncbi:MAG: carbamoyltransferase HypF [Oscillospiraceae bacterium]|nr:carbamoyltransferase HypF [Oscillospiraceae bacterium]